MHVILWNFDRGSQEASDNMGICGNNLGANDFSNKSNWYVRASRLRNVQPEMCKAWPLRWPMVKRPSTTCAEVRQDSASSYVELLPKSQIKYQFPVLFRSGARHCGMSCFRFGGCWVHAWQLFKRLPGFLCVGLELMLPGSRAAFAALLGWKIRTINYIKQEQPRI